MANKKNAEEKRKFMLPATAALVLLVALALLITPQGGKKETFSETDSLTIPLSSVSQNASFYPIVVNGTEMEVLAIRTASGEIRTAFNTCQSCYTSGHGYYVADGTELICQNCGFHFTAEEVGLEGHGGCNPWPIPVSERTETEDSILISYEALNDAREIFANWSK